MKPLQFILFFGLSTLCMGAFGQSDFYRCFGTSVKDAELCVPSFSMGNRIIAVANSQQALGELANYLNATMHGHGELEEFGPVSKAEVAIANANENAGTFQAVVNSFFPEFISKHLNSQIGYDGPNCYDTALMMVGIVPEVRYVHTYEFLFYINNYFNNFFNIHIFELIYRQMSCFKG